MSPRNTVALGGRLTIADLDDVAHRGAALALAPSARAAMERCHTFVRDLAGAGTPVYGLTTGCGPLAGHRIDAAQREAELRDGSLVRLLPDWHLPGGYLQVAYTHRRGMLPAVRAWIEHLVQAFARSDLPPVSSPSRDSKNGVTAGPRTPAASAWRSASNSATSNSPDPRATFVTTGWASTTPAPPRPQCADSSRAASAGVSTRADIGSPVE